MKYVLLNLVLLLVLMHQAAFAQTGEWNLAGNSLAGTEKFGSTNAKPIRFFTNNVQRMTLGSNGFLGIGGVAGKGPQSLLHVGMGKSGADIFNTGATIITESNTDNFINIVAPEKQKTGLFFGNNKNTAAGAILYNEAFNKNGLSFITPHSTTIITDAGFLGVGTITPAARMHVFNGPSGALPSQFSTMVVESSGSNFITLANRSVVNSGLLFTNELAQDDGGIIYGGVTPRGFQFNTNGNSTRMVITNTGAVGIGTKQPASELHVLHSNSANVGLRLENNTAGGKAWNIFEFGFDDGDLGFAANNATRGFFDNISGVYSSLSDVRAKKDIEPSPEVLDKVMQLQVKKYHFLPNKTSDKKYYGMMAQDVEKLFPEIVSHKVNKEQDVYAVNYGAYGVIAIKAIQEQQQKIEKQEQTNQTQQQTIAALEERIARLEAALNKSNTNTANAALTSKQTGNAVLEQNTPNPFNQSTVIHYRLPQGSLGQINVFDSNGILVHSYKASESGQTSISGADLKPGTYLYALVIAGTIIGSKKMILVK